MSHKSEGTDEVGAKKKKKNNLRTGTTTQTANTFQQSTEQRER
jgi:hypothetical protein